MCTLNVLNKSIDVVSLVSGVVSAGTQLLSNNSYIKNAEQQAKNAERQSVSERQEGIESARNKRLQFILNMGKEKTNIASNNINLASQTALDIIDDENLQGEMASLSILNKSNYNADLYAKKADQYYKNASLTSFKSQSDFANKLFKIAATI